MLGVFQTLVQSKRNDSFGFLVINAVIQKMPHNSLSQYFQGILMCILRRLQSNKTVKFSLLCVTFMANFINFSHSQNSCQILIEGFNAIQPGLFGMFLSSTISESEKIKDNAERKLCLLAFIKLLEHVLSTEYSQHWANILLMSIRVVNSYVPKEIKEDDLIEIEQSGYHASYTKLAVLLKTAKYPVTDLPDPKPLLLSTLKSLGSYAPQISASMQTLDPQSISEITQFLQLHGIQF